jgi:hypothetical protein
MNRLTIALIASALSATAAAGPWNPLDALESPAAKAKQQMVQETAVYPQEGATSGIAANKMRLQRDTPPVLATMQEKQDAVAATAVYPQEGATSGKQAVKMREQRGMPHPLATMRDKQEAVDSVTKANAGG